MNAVVSTMRVVLDENGLELDLSCCALVDNGSTFDCRLNMTGDDFTGCQDCQGLGPLIKRKSNRLVSTP